MTESKCPKCGKSFRIRQEMVGRKGRCPGCQNVFVVEASSVDDDDLPKLQDPEPTLRAAAAPKPAAPRRKVASKPAKKKTKKKPSISKPVVIGIVALQLVVCGVGAVFMFWQDGGADDVVADSGDTTNDGASAGDSGTPAVDIDLPPMEKGEVVVIDTPAEVSRRPRVRGELFQPYAAASGKSPDGAGWSALPTVEPAAAIKTPLQGRPLAMNRQRYVAVTTELVSPAVSFKQEDFTSKRVWHAQWMDLASGEAMGPPVEILTLPFDAGRNDHLPAPFYVLSQIRQNNVPRDPLAIGAVSLDNSRFAHEDPRQRGVIVVRDAGCRLLHRLDPEDGEIRWMMFAPSGELWTLGQSKLSIWDTASGNQTRQLSATVGAVPVVSQSRKWLAVANEKNIEVLDFASAEVRGVLAASEEKAVELSLSPDERHLAALYDNDPGSIVVWDLSDGSARKATLQLAERSYANHGRMVWAGREHLLVMRVETAPAFRVQSVRSEEPEPRRTNDVVYDVAKGREAGRMSGVSQVVGTFRKIHDRLWYESTVPIMRRTDWRETDPAIRLVQMEILSSNSPLLAADREYFDIADSKVRVEAQLLKQEQSQKQGRRLATALQENGVRIGRGGWTFRLGFSYSMVRPDGKFERGMSTPKVTYLYELVDPQGRVVWNESRSDTWDPRESKYRISEEEAKQRGLKIREEGDAFNEEYYYTHFSFPRGTSPAKLMVEEVLDHSVSLQPADLLPHGIVYTPSGAIPTPIVEKAAYPKVRDVFFAKTDLRPVRTSERHRSVSNRGPDDLLHLVCSTTTLEMAREPYTFQFTPDGKRLDVLQLEATDGGQNLPVDKTATILSYDLASQDWRIVDQFTFQANSSMNNDRRTLRVNAKERMMLSRDLSRVTLARRDGFVVFEIGTSQRQEMAYPQLDLRSWPYMAAVAQQRLLCIATAPLGAATGGDSSGSENKCYLSIWDLASKKHTSTIEERGVLQGAILPISGGKAAVYLQQFQPTQPKSRELRLLDTKAGKFISSVSLAELPADAKAYVISPDGRRLAFVSGKRAGVVDITWEGEPRLSEPLWVFHSDSVREVVLSDDASTLVTCGTRLVAVDVDSRRQLRDFGKDVVDSDRTVAISPDGRYLALGRAVSPKRLPWRILVFDLHQSGTGEPQSLPFPDSKK